MFTNLGLARQFFGIEIYRDDHGISLGQKSFIATILNRFHMQDTHGIVTPMDSNVKLHLADDRWEKKLEKESVKHYQGFVGSLMYAALTTRPDISYRVAAVHFAFIHQPFDCNGGTKSQ
jgi:hypothetical protein